MNILITGVTGFLGTNLVSSLTKLPGTRIFGHSRNSNEAAKKFSADDVTLIKDCDLESLKQNNIDIIIHLAGIAHDLSNQYQPEDYFRVNNIATRELFNSFLRSNAEKFIFLSSIKAAVDIANEPVTEDVPCNPVTPYGQSKLMAEQFMQAQTMPHGKRFFILRPCMIHGKGNKGNLNVLFKFVKRGIPFPFAAFVNRRSFLNIDNFDFIIHELIAKDIDSGIYNLSDEGYLSTTELYKLVAKASKKKGIALAVPRALISTAFATLGKTHMLKKLTENMMVSNQKIIRAIGKPLPLSLEDGIIKTIRSFRS
jgi:nucleoside-diphosphate-sugar epimerase